MKKLLFIIILMGILDDTFCQEELKLSKINSTEDYINFYQKSISDLRGNSCPMFPSCANYTLDIIKEGGLVKGILLGSDRLLRCGHEHKFYNLTLQDKGFKLLDHPVSDQNTKLEYKKSKSYYPDDLINNDSVVNEILLLINSGYISEAIILINRYKIKNSLSNPIIDELELICLNNKKEFQNVIYKYSLFDSLSKNNSGILKQYFIACYNNGNYTGIINEAYKIRQIDKDDYLQRQLNKYVFSSYLNQEQISEADIYYKKEFININDIKDANETILKYKNINKKSSKLATAMSIVLPGSGYIYAGHFTTGISSLLINSLIAYATYTSFRSKNTGMGILTGIVGLGFYIGNIQGSSKSIYRENNYYKNNIIKKYNEQSFLN